MVGLLVGIDFSPNASEFETLLKNGDLVQGLQYVTIELTKQEARNKKYLTTMFQGAATKQGWPQGVHKKLTIKKAAACNEATITAALAKGSKLLNLVEDSNPFLTNGNISTTNNAIEVPRINKVFPILYNTGSNPSSKNILLKI